LAAELPLATVRGFLKNMYHTFLAVQPPSTESLLMPLAQPDHLQIGSFSPAIYHGYSTKYFLLISCFTNINHSSSLFYDFKKAQTYNLKIKEVNSGYTIVGTIDFNQLHKAQIDFNQLCKTQVIYRSSVQKICFLAL